MRKLWLLIFITLLSTQLFSQFGKSSWYIIQEDEDKVVYIDTSRVSMQDENVSVWSMILYPEPFMMTSINENISKSKTKYLYNTIEKNFTVVGAMYYDATGRLLNTGTAVPLSSAADLQFIDVKGDPTLQNIFEKAENYARTGRINSEPSKVVEKLEEDVVFNNKPTDLEVNKKTSDPWGDDEDDDWGFVDDGKDSWDDNETKIETKVADIKKIESVPPVGNPSINTAGRVPVPSVQLDEPKKEEPLVLTYNDDADKALPGNFYTDGNLYCYQVSAWKNKNKAIRQADKLISKGYSAYVMEKYVPKLRKTWYRVRVGLFKSLEEAKTAKRSK